MDLAQGLILDVGWIFLIAWGAVLAAVSLAAFGKDILRFVPRATHQPEQH